LDENWKAEFVPKEQSSFGLLYQLHLYRRGYMSAAFIADEYWRECEEWQAPLVQSLDLSVVVLSLFLSFLTSMPIMSRTLVCISRIYGSEAD